MNKKLLRKAVSGNIEALAELRQTIHPKRTVFVMSEGAVDTKATLEAYDHFRIHGVAPDEWNDEPTVTLDQAFVKRVRRHPLTLAPVTPGTWAKLWASENGHRIVAAIHWGISHGHIREGALELRGRVRGHLNSPDQLLLDIVVEMERNEEQARIAMQAVLSPIEQSAPRVALKPSPRQVGQAASDDALEAAYGRGEIDIGRYLKIKAASTSDETWSHEKYIALSQIIREYFSMSEISTLIFDMGLDSDDFSRQRNAAARELTSWAKRRKQLSKLSNLVKQANPSRWAAFAANWV